MIRRARRTSYGEDNSGNRRNGLRYVRGAYQRGCKECLSGKESGKLPYKEADGHPCGERHPGAGTEKRGGKGGIRCRIRKQ